MNSIEHYGLPVSRAAFVRGRDPFRYLAAFNAALFLSADGKNVKEAVMKGLPAGQVLASTYTADPNDRELRVAFDFDGVIVDDEAERVYQIEGIDRFQESEVRRAGAAQPRTVEASARTDRADTPARDRTKRRAA
jgi:5'-nucleotidase